MIEKLKWDEQPEDAAKEVQNLIDQLVDAVNELQPAKDVMFNRIDMLNNAICDIRNRITALDDPTYHEEPAENVLTKSLRIDKEFAEEEMERLQKENSDLKDEVEKLQKQLNIATSGLNVVHYTMVNNNDLLGTVYRMKNAAGESLDEVKGLDNE